MTYDFAQLNDKEFEIIVSDLLSEFFGFHIERFRQGKDKGVDGRFFINLHSEAIIQCKHYVKTGYGGLISKLKSEECFKVKKINPKRYIFVTSLSLSRENKKEIVQIFNPFIKREDDVLGQEDLNDLLAKNPQIEEKFYKLWISSTVVLKRILNNAVKGRSEFELDRIIKNSHKYVTTDNNNKALNILKKNHVLIISGEPGIGKTSLAENLCLFFACKGYEFIDIEESLSEAENIFQKGKKQIFYFDDFLGSNYFEAIENKKDSHIVKFMDRVANDKFKFFILTSRTNILNNGVLYSSWLANKNIRSKEFLLNVQNLSIIDKAKILYNHIWFSDLPEEFINEIYKDKRYKKIIEHRNFNPRLIEFITDKERIDNSCCSNYWSYIEEKLDHPRDIWSDCFKNQNNDYVRNLVMLTVFNGGKISEKKLQESYSCFNQLEKLKNISHSEKDFYSMSNLATKSFLNRHKLVDKFYYSLFNPSITDFVINEYAHDTNKLINIFKSLDSVESLDVLKNLKNEKIVFCNNVVNIEKAIFYDAFKKPKNYDYLISISEMIPDFENKDKYVIGLLENIISNPRPIKEFLKFLNILIYYIDCLKLNSYNFISVCIGKKQFDEYEILEFADLINILGLEENNDIIQVFRASLISFLILDLEDQKSEIDLSKIIKYNTTKNGPELDYDPGIIQDELYDLTEIRIKEFHSDFMNNLCIDIYKEVVENIDIDEIVEEYLDSQKEFDYDDYREYSYFDHSGVAIDDLFEKS